MVAAFRPARAHETLGGAFYDPVAPARFPKTILRYRNQRAAARMGLEGLSDAAWISHFGRFEPLPGSLPQPLALRYHGHQFRVYNQELGDGRGFLFAQGHDLLDGRLMDFGTKGSGTTPWSRTADGRLTLKGGVREVLATEMLEALGVYTSKSFSLIETGEELWRGDEPSPTRSSVLVRLSHSHVRIGTFQRLAALEDQANIAKLRDYSTKLYFDLPDLADEGARTRAFLERVVANVARLGAQWMAAGFVHGVLNTDNINITGESFDYGPWRFLPQYDPAFTAAYFDERGLYAFGRQPDALVWNLARLMECFLPFLDLPVLEEILGQFGPAFEQEMGAAFTRRLGLVRGTAEQEGLLVRALFGFARETKPFYEQMLFDWYGGLQSAERAARSGQAALYAGPLFDHVRRALAPFEAAPEARLDHPYFARSVPRTMLIEEVEAIWAPIAEHDDWSAFEAVLADIGVMAEAYGREASPVV